MKSLLFKLSLSLLLFGIAGYSFSQNSEDIRFEKSKLKFDKLEEGTPVEIKYSFTYSGEFPLNITPPEVDCTCTEVVLPEGEIIKGKPYTIIIKFDTKDKIGYQEREVILHFTSDAMDSRSIAKTIVFRGVVKASKATKEAYQKKD